MLTRRGFIQTMAALAAGATANFDTLKGLWVPGAVEGAVPDLVAPAVTWTKAAVDVQAELNDLALQFARAMTDRVMRSKAVVLRQIMLQHSGHANLGLITLTDEAGSHQGRGHFEPSQRVMTEMTPLWATALAIDHAAGNMARTVQGCDMFVPIGSDLRNGVPFTNCLVGVATDPESGLSARALRFTTIDGQLRTGLEVAVGDWHGTGARARRRGHGMARTTRILLSPELLETEEAGFEATSKSADRKMTYPSEHIRTLWSRRQSNEV